MTNEQLTFEPTYPEWMEIDIITPPVSDAEGYECWHTLGTITREVDNLRRLFRRSNDCQCIPVLPYLHNCQATREVTTTFTVVLGLCWYTDIEVRETFQVSDYPSSKDALAAAKSWALQQWNDFHNPEV